MDNISNRFTMTSRKAILVVSFGTSYNDTRAKTIGAIEARIGNDHPGWEIRRAFTSRMIIRKLKERDGEIVDYVNDAMERLISDGVRTVVVQPTHIMNGMEYDDVVRIVGEYSDRFDHIAMGSPLLTTEEDYDKVVEAIRTDILPEAEALSGKDAAVVLMGHGSEHYANATYSQLQLKLALSGLDNVFVTTVEGFPTFDDTLTMMDGKGFKDAVLLPFMLVAGDHANNDMAGDEEDSLASIMSSAGYGVKSIVKGLGEYPSFEDMFSEHAGCAMERLLKAQKDQSE